jgi:hypothetical protein
MAFSRHENYSHRKKAVNSFLPSTIFFPTIFKRMREKIHISNCNIGNDSINILIGVIELYVLFFSMVKKKYFL